MQHLTQKKRTWKDFPGIGDEVTIFSSDKPPFSLSATDRTHLSGVKAVLSYTFSSHSCARQTKATNGQENREKKPGSCSFFWQWQQDGEERGWKVIIHFCTHRRFISKEIKKGVSALPNNSLGLLVQQTAALGGGGVPSSGITGALYRNDSKRAHKATVTNGRKQQKILYFLCGFFYVVLLLLVAHDTFLNKTKQWTAHLHLFFFLLDMSAIK